MVTLEKFEFGSDEYQTEVERENAYFLNEIICAITNGMNFSKNTEKLLNNMIRELEKEIGDEEITVSLKFGLE